MKERMKKLIAQVLCIVLMTGTFLGAMGPLVTEPVHAAGNLKVVISYNGSSVTFENKGIGDTFSKSDFNIGGATVSFFDSCSGSMKYGMNSVTIISTGSGTVTAYVTTPVYGQVTFSVDVIDHEHSWTDASYSASDNVITATCQGNGTCDLAKPTLTLNASGKTYDGSAVTATLTKSDTWTSQNLPTPSITYDPANSKNAGTYTASVTVGNATATQSFTISPKQLTLTGVTAEDKTYDGTDVANLNTASADLSGKIGSDDVQIDEVTGVYTAGKTAGNGKAISATATLKGTDVGNYEISPISLTANISKKDIKLKEIYINDKVYDGSINATRSTSKLPDFDGLVEGDVVNYRADCTFEDRHVGNNKTVNVEPGELYGKDAKNYNLIENVATTSTASITPADLYISGITVSDKEYDGNASANADIENASFTKKSPFDDVSINPGSVQASFNDKNVGNDKLVTVTLNLQGEQKDNYNPVITDVKGNINPKPIKVSDITVDTKEYDKTTDAVLNTANATFEGILSGDELTVSGTGTFGDAAVGTDKAVSITGLTLGGATASNYSIAAESQSTATGTITKRAITVSGITASDKLYDGTTDATLVLSGITLNGKLDGDDISVNEDKIKGAFASKTAGTDKIVNISGYELKGNDAVNYILAENGQQETTTANIATKEITVSEIEAVDKVYDGNANATLNFENVILTGKEAGDDLSVTANGSFADKNVDQNKTVYIAGLQLSGSDAANYVLAKNGQQTTATATITKRPAKVEGITASDKVYDGTTAATVNKERATFVNMVEGDELTVSTTGEFVDKNAGENKTVKLGTLTFGGADVDNYEFVAADQQKEATATISKKPVNVAAVANGKVFDEEDPELEYVADALIEGDGAEYMGNVAREEGEAVGVYEIKIGTLSAGDNYEINFAPADFTIAKAMTNNMDLTMTGWTYGDDPKTPLVTVDHGEDAVVITYSNASDGEYNDEVPTDVGTYFVKAKVEETEDYVGAEEIASFTIEQREAKLEWADQELEYNGEAQKPTATVGNLVDGDECDVVVTGEQVDANVKSGIEKYDAEAVELTGTKANNYKLPDEVTTAFVINPKQITQEMLSIENDVLQKNGNEQSPSITLTDGRVLVQDEDYLLSGDVKSDKVGTHFITIEGTGNYTSTLKTSWMIYSTKDNYQKEEGEGGCGDLEILVDIEGNTENITVDNLTIEIARKLLTEEDIERYNAGENVLIYVELFEESKAAADATEEKLLLKMFKEIGAEDIRWFDITVWKKIGNDAAVQLHEIGTALDMTIEVPSDHQKAEEGYTRTFYFGRAHDGEAEVIAETGEIKVKFSSDKFSTYALGFKDTENKKEEVEPGEGSGSESGEGSGEGSGSESGTGDGSGSEGTGEGSGSEGTGEAGTGEGAGSGEGSGSGNEGTGEGAGSGSGTGEGSGSGSKGTGEAGTGRGANGETGPLTGTPNLIAGNPNTGDDNNILIWIGVVLLAAAIALTVRRQFK